MANQQDRTGQKRALIIGISHYTNPNLQELDFCKNDGLGLYDVLGNPKYDFYENNKFVGEVNGDDLREAINAFFRNKSHDDKRDIHSDDTLVFYYSGHGVLDFDGDGYLAGSDIDPDEPYSRGFSLKDLTKRMQNSISTKVVVILDCCYSGSAKLGKGDDEAAAKLGRKAIDENTRSLLTGQGKYILSASQAAQEAFGRERDGHSIFTFFLLKGLKGTTDSVDSEGNVTPRSLAKYIYRRIMSLPANERPKQTPVMKTEESGDVILARHPELRPDTKDDSPVVLPTVDSSGSERRKYQFLVRRNRYHLVLPIVAAAVAVAVIFVVIPWLNDFLQRSDPAFGYGSQAALADMQNGRLFNPACDPTGAHAIGGQHPTAYCTAWTIGYISTWNVQHPGWTNGYIYAWKPYNPPANGSVLSCQQCATRLKPIIRYINGSNDGIQAAVSNVRDGKPFNPACDPTHSHTSDGLHTTVYCNGWTNGYISAWNARHSIIPSIPNLVACKKEFSESIVCTPYAYANTSGTHSQRSTK